MSSWLTSLGSSILKRSTSEAGIVGGEGGMMMTPATRPLQYNNNSLDIDSLPEILDESEILRLDEIHFLSKHLPARVLGSDWTLKYSTSSHGFSLNNVYRKFQNGVSPTLVAIQDTEGGVFGALVSHPLRFDEHFYGTGESFLYSLRPKKEIYNWSGENQLFIQGTAESLIIGAGEGHFGIFVDSNLYKGRSQSCSTYQNEPLAPKGDFIIKTMECWTFC